MHSWSIRNTVPLRGIIYAAGYVATTLTTYACAPRKRLFLMLLVLVVFTTSILSIIDTRLAREDMFSLKLADMQNEIEFLTSSYRNKQEEIINLKMRLQDPTGENNANHPQHAEDTFAPDIDALLKNLNDTRLIASLRPKKTLGASFIYQLFPHHMNSPRSVYPAFYMKSPRNVAEYVFGIPTIKRDKENYLLITLEHLIAGLKDKYENSTLIVVCVGETDLEYVVSVAQKVTTKFPKYVESGLIEVISPSPDFYPDFNKEKPNLGDSFRRFRWRSKQNLDSIFLMAYAQTKGTYYLMLEDDIIPKLTYMDAIKKYTTEVSVSNPDWIFIEYCTIGGIGKLFKSSTLKHFVMYLALFYRNMPIDWLLEKYLETRECSIDMSPKVCAKVKLRVRPRYSMLLFQHIGLYSSLKGKLQKVQDAKFITAPKFYPHRNPPLQFANTSIKIYKQWSLMDAYLGLNFFWGIKPKKGDLVEFIFREPLYIKSYLFRSGNIIHVSDKFRHTVIEVIPARGDQNITKVGAFDEFGLAEGTIKKAIGPIQSIRLRVTQNLSTWVILSEISLTEYESKTTELPTPEG